MSRGFDARMLSFYAIGHNAVLESPRGGDLDEVIVNGHKLRELREARGLTQGQLAVKSGVGQSHISRLEAGQRPNAKVSTVARLAHALGVGIDDLLASPRKFPRLDGLPDFHVYVSRKFAQTPKFRRALVQAYEALQMIKEEEERRAREREESERKGTREDGQLNER